MKIEVFICFSCNCILLLFMDVYNKKILEGANYMSFINICCNTKKMSAFSLKDKSYSKSIYEKLYEKR